MRVALYARVSSEGQADQGTIDAQADFLRRYAELNSLDIAGEYFDEAITGPTPLIERPAGRRLVEDARAKKFGKVLFYRVDRFARSLRELLEAQALLDAMGIGLQSATEPFDTATPMGRFMFQLLGGIAELEKSVILERTASGRARVVRDGKWPGGPAPFGYCILDGRLAPSPTEADVIKDLYQRIASGSTLVREFNRLNDEGLYGRQGKLWTMGGLSKLVHQPIYKGEHTFHGRGGTIVRDVPALVTAELWAEAHAQLKRNSTARETKRFSLLKGKMRCANCGGSYVLSSRAKRKQFYYRCISTLRLTARRCKSANLNATALENYVWGECLDLLQAPNRISSYAANEILHLTEADKNRGKDVRRLQTALAGQEAAKQRIIRLVHLDKITEAEADQELDLINGEVGRLHGQLSALDSSRSLAGEYVRRLSTGPPKKVSAFKRLWQ
jgi:site-specific DNA recombinase